jgi:Xaa-Pro aminopeptidase
MKKEDFIERRKKLFAKISDNELVILLSREESELYLRFNQDKNLFYMTGLETPKTILVMFKKGETETTFCFIERNVPEKVVWYGEKMSKQAAKEISGIEQIYFYDELNSVLHPYLSVAENVYVNYETSELLSSKSNALVYVNELRNNYPNLKFKQFNTIVSSLRSVKDDSEIEELQKAINITGAGIERIMRNSKSGMYEYQLESMLYDTMLSNGYREWGFTPIIAQGGNAATLHYSANNAIIEENKLVLLDVGAASSNYSADISRTFPISGKFTERQKEVYLAVLDVQKKIINLVKPGISLKELNDITIELISQKLINLGLIEDEKNYRKYYMHSVSHHLGLDTHDLGSRTSVLEIGNVITVEPGIYIPEEEIGVRIEDDILVTENGHIILSGNIPKEIEDLEKLMLGK